MMRIICCQNMNAVILVMQQVDGGRAATACNLDRG
jgi:hypothetical protein